MEEEEEEREDEREDDPVRHDVLTYVFPQICSLEDYLARAGFRRNHLVQMGDAPPYVQLLHRALVGVPRDSFPLPPPDLELFVQQEAHLSMLHGLVADLVKTGSKKKGRNVLCLGLWNAKSADVNGVDGMGGVECAWPNSALNIVRGLSWQKLHERIGTDCLRFLLREVLVFQLLPNNCYLQLCGIAITSLIRAYGNRRHDAHLASTLLLNNKAHKRALSLLAPRAVAAPIAAPVAGAANSEPKGNGQKKLPPVRRARIFYNEKFVKKAGFSLSHVLSHSTCQPTTAFARHLCRIVFQLGPSQGRLPKRYRGMIVPLTQLVHNHLKLRYGFFLRIHCPLPQLRGDGSGAETGGLTFEDIVGHEPSYRELIANHTEHFHVVKFVWACVSRLVPRSVWCCDENFQTARAMVDSFVRLRRYEEFDVDYWAAKWKMKPCSWIPPAHSPSQFTAHQRMVGQWMRWLVGELVVPLVRNHFYVTESAVHRNKVFYYRKPLWKQIVTADLGRNDDVSRIRDMFRPLADEEAKYLLNNSFHLPASQLRLLPKASGMRLIGNLSQRTASGGDSANFLLRPSFEALRWELLTNGKEHLLGCSVFSLGDVHAKMLPFIQWFRQQNGAKKLFFVSVDVKSSFDSVNQKQLCKVLFEEKDAVLQNNRYVLQRYSVHLPCVGHLATSYKATCLPAHELQPLHVTLRRLMQNSTSLRNSVLVDNSSCEYLARQSAEDMLRHHITQNVIYMRGRYYLQEVGIPQGSVLSSLLCSLFYGHMERHGLADLPISFADNGRPDEDKGVLVRFIDDNLFVTSNEAAATDFVNRLHGAFLAEYGTQLNASKTLVNFDCMLPGGDGVVLQQAVSDDALPTLNPCLPWCGVLIDTVTLEFFGDYTRYRGNYMNESLTVSYCNHPGNSLRQKIKQFAQPKCIPLLLDSRINSWPVILINVYQIFLLSAIKYHCHARHLPLGQNQRFLFDVLVDLVEYTNALIQSRLKGDPTKTLTPCHVRFLGRHAFYTILQRKQTCYASVVATLETQLRRECYFAGLEKLFEETTNPAKHRLFLREILF